MFAYTLKKAGQKATIEFKGDLDIDVSEVMKDEIIPALLSYKEVEIDLSDVPFVDSTGIELLIHLVEVLYKHEESIQIKIQNIQPLVKEVFEMLQLEEISENYVKLIKADSLTYM